MHYLRFIYHGCIVLCTAFYGVKLKFTGDSYSRVVYNQAGMRGDKSYHHEIRELTFLKTPPPLSDQGSKIKYLYRRPLFQLRHSLQHMACGALIFQNGFLFKKNKHLFSFRKRTGKGQTIQELLGFSFAGDE